MAHVYGHILVWNDRHYLPDLLESIEAQTYEDFTLRILENGSTDDTYEYLSEKAPRTVVARNTKNAGFAGGHNQLIKYTLDHMPETDPVHTYILIANADMIWKNNLVANLVEALEQNPDKAAAQPKLYRAFGEDQGIEDFTETIKSDVIDTTGLHIGKNWRMSDRGAGEMDAGQYDIKTDVFAASGTMMLIRLSALREVMMGDDFYDSDFFAYREDCDIAMRMHGAGMKSLFVPSAHAWHYRGMYGAENQNWVQRIKNRRGQRPFFAALSSRNQLLFLMKHLTPGHLFRYGLWIVPTEGLRTLYGMLMEPMTRGRLLEIPRMLPKTLEKRKEIYARRTESPSSLKKYVS